MRKYNGLLVAVALCAIAAHAQTPGQTWHSGVDQSFASHATLDADVTHESPVALGVPAAAAEHTGAQIGVTSIVSVVPEPETWLLIALGLAAVLLRVLKPGDAPDRR